MPQRGRFDKPQKQQRKLDSLPLTHPEGLKPSPDFLPQPKEYKPGHGFMAHMHLTPSSLAQCIVDKMGVRPHSPPPEPFLPPTKEDLWKTLTDIPKNGTTYYQHPGFKGRGFTNKQIDEAIGFAIEAEKAFFEGIETLLPKSRPPYTIQLILEMVDNKEFGMASKKADTTTQMRIALGAVAIKNRIEEIMERNPSMGHIDATKQAKKDVEGAQKLATQFIGLRRLLLKRRPVHVPELVERMNEMEWKGIDAELFAFDMAMKVIDEHLVRKIDKELMAHEKELIMGVLGKEGEYGWKDLAEFLDMHPGVRDLLVRNFIASRWTEGNWKADIGKYTDARNSLYKACGLREPTKNEKLEALLQLKHLSKNQLYLISLATDGGASPLTEEHIRNFRTWASSDPKPLDHWRSGTIDLLTLGDLAHKMGFLSGWDYTPEETKLLSGILNPEAKDKHSMFPTVQITEEAKEALTAAFLNPHTPTEKEYKKRIEALASEFGDAMKIGPLLEAAQKQAEFHVLLDFLDVPFERASGRIDYRNCETREGKKNEVDATNEDSFSSAVVTLPNGRKALLDAVFDGMGGHKKGEVASRIARDVFEIAAIAGWIQSPEDVRRTFIIAHLAIIMKDPKSDMGTTAVVSFQCGKEFYGIHCGDSDYLVIRGGVVVLQSIGHTVINLRRRQGKDPKPNQRNMITSALGSLITDKEIHINNKVRGYKPFMLENIDVISTFSDGIGDIVCGHEHRIIIDDCGGDLPAARRGLIDLAESRDDSGRSYQTLCQCGEKIGKPDDKTVALHYAQEGF